MARQYTVVGLFSSCTVNRRISCPVRERTNWLSTAPVLHAGRCVCQCRVPAHGGGTCRRSSDVSGLAPCPPCDPLVPGHHSGDKRNPERRNAPQRSSTRNASAGSVG